MKDEISKCNTNTDYYLRKSYLFGFENLSLLIGNRTNVIDQLQKNQNWLKGKDYLIANKDICELGTEEQFWTGKVNTDEYLGLKESCKLNIEQLSQNMESQGLLNELVKLPSINVYPIPTTQILNIDLTNWSDKANLRIMNQTGITIQSQTVYNKSQLDISDLATGIYHLYFINQLGQSQTKTIIKQ